MTKKQILVSWTRKLCLRQSTQCLLFISFSQFLSNPCLEASNPASIALFNVLEPLWALSGTHNSYLGPTVLLRHHSVLNV